MTLTNEKSPGATIIREGAEVVTLVNVFEVDPADQDRLLRVLIDATEDVMKTLPGFISANFHKSLDGRRVVNYAQWLSKDHFQQMLATPAAQAHMTEAESIGKVEPRMYEVVSCHHLETPA